MSNNQQVYVKLKTFYVFINFLAKRVPFEVTFMSDGFEYQGDAAPSEFKAADGTSKGIKGFQLYFIQS